MCQLPLTGPQFSMHKIRILAMVYCM